MQPRPPPVPAPEFPAPASAPRARRGARLSRISPRCSGGPPGRTPPRRPLRPLWPRAPLTTLKPPDGTSNWNSIESGIMSAVTRPRLVSILSFVLLLVSLTEAAEVWTRVVVASTTLSYAKSNISHLRSLHHRSRALASGPLTRHSASSYATASTDEIVTDIPLWTFSHAPVLLAPWPSFAVSIVLTPFTYSTETRGPPALSVQFVTLSLRAPPFD